MARAFPADSRLKLLMVCRFYGFSSTTAFAEFNSFMSDIVNFGDEKSWSGFVSVRLIKDYLEDASSVLILMDISNVS